VRAEIHIEKAKLGFRFSTNGHLNSFYILYTNFLSENSFFSSMYLLNVLLVVKVKHIILECEKVFDHHKNKH